MDDQEHIPSVSIITPAYNAEPYLEETIDSALGQSFSDFELLIVDDGSRDGTLAVARGLAARDPRVHVMATPNRGASAARNTAMERARAPFFALLDSDDTWSKDYLAEQLSLLQRFPEVSIVTANAINHGGRLDGKPFWPTTSGNRTLTLREILEEEDAVCIMSMFRRQAFDTIGGFDSRFNGNEDYHFWIRAAHAGFVILQNRTPLGQYRRRTGSLSADERRMLGGMMSVLKEAEDLCAGCPAECAAIRRQLHRFRTDLTAAELRESLQRRDAANAAQFLRALSTLRGSWILSAAARVSAAWPTSLLWADRVRRALRA